MADEAKKSSSSSSTPPPSSSTPTTSTSTNPRGIPSAPFIDSVETYVSSRTQVESTLRGFQEMISKYQFMELNTSRRAAGLRDKIPEMQRSLDVVRFLKIKSRTAKTASTSAADTADADASDTATDTEATSAKAAASTTLQTTFSLIETLYAHANIELPLPNDEVFLWLGANVMLAYTVDEAESMLSEKLTAAKRSLEACQEDMDFLREQVTTLEVATARVYNWEVTQKRKEKEMMAVEEGRRRGEKELKTLPNR
ncbi:MAG: hypothetical protein M1816_007225 [Peltula sp. TS41687]|nr:MAG: hypothetical protein M1816_007225 [Peltula sp. TS41687]